MDKHYQKYSTQVKCKLSIAPDLILDSLWLKKFE